MKRRSRAKDDELVFNFNVGYAIGLVTGGLAGIILMLLIATFGWR